MSRLKNNATSHNPYRSNLLLTTRGKDVISTDNDERTSLVESLFAGEEKFSFEGLAAGGWDVEFKPCSAKKGGDELAAVRNFIAS